MKILLSSLAVLAMLHVAFSTPYPGVSMQALLDKLQQVQVEQEVPQVADSQDDQTEPANVAAFVQQQEDGQDTASEEGFGSFFKKAFHHVRRGVKTYNNLVGGCVSEQDDQAYPVSSVQDDEMEEPQETAAALLKQLQQQMVQGQEDDDTAEAERRRRRRKNRGHGRRNRGHRGHGRGHGRNGRRNRSRYGGYGRRVHGLARWGFQTYNQLNGRCETEQAELQEALETLAQLQQVGPSEDLMDDETSAQVQQDMEAAMEGFWSKMKSWGRKAYNGAKTGCKYIPLEDQNMAETEFLGTAYTLIKGACNHIRGNQVTTEGILGFSLNDLKAKGKKLLGYAKTGCKKYDEYSGIVKSFIGEETKYLDMICSGLKGSEPAVVQLLLNNAIRSVVEDKEQADIEQSVVQELIRSFAN